MANPASRYAMAYTGEYTRDLRSFSPSSLSCAVSCPRSRLLRRSAGVSRGRRRPVDRGRRAQDFGEAGFQRIGPHLVRQRREMQAVVGDAVAQAAVGKGQLFLDVYVTHGLAVGEAR